MKMVSKETMKWETNDMTPTILSLRHDEDQSPPKVCRYNERNESKVTSKKVPQSIQVIMKMASNEVMKGDMNTI